MQLLCRIATGGYSSWRKAFDAHAENRGYAGLTLLQLWRAADDADVVMALFEVSERAIAQEYITTEAALGHQLGTCTFLNVA